MHYRQCIHWRNNQKYEQSSHIKSSSFQKKQCRRLSSKLDKPFSNVKTQLEPSTNQNLGLHVVAWLLGETIDIVQSLKGGRGVERGAQFISSYCRERTSGARVGEWKTRKTLVKVNSVIPFVRDKEIL